MTKLVLQSGKVLQTRIDRFGKTIAATQQEAHDIGVQVVGHYAEHNDYTLIARFVGGKIGKRLKGETAFTISDDFPGVCGTLRKNILAWIVKFTDLRVNDKGMMYRMNRKSDSFAKHLASNNDLATDVDTAEATPWWTLDGAKRDSAVVPIDLLNLLAMADAIGKRVNNAVEADAERAQDDTSHKYVPEQLTAMQAFAAAIEAAKEAFIASQNVNVVQLEAERKQRKAGLTVDPTADPQEVPFEAPANGNLAAGTPVADAA